MKSFTIIASLLVLIVRSDDDCSQSPIAEKCENKGDSDVCAELFADPANCADEKYSFFLDGCYKTCKMCCRDEHFTCDDDPLPGMPCPTDSASCNAFVSVNFEHCKSSCGWCTLKDAPCVDSSTSCPDMAVAGMCELYDDVKTECQLSCGVCTDDSDGQCNDASTRCLIWVGNGFCKDDFYMSGATAQYCKKSCGFCK